jgi:hypothetical protein
MRTSTAVCIRTDSDRSPSEHRTATRSHPASDHVRRLRLSRHLPSSRAAPIKRRAAAFVSHALWRPASLRSTSLPSSSASPILFPKVDRPVPSRPDPSCPPGCLFRAIRDASTAVGDRDYDCCMDSMKRSHATTRLPPVARRPPTLRSTGEARSNRRRARDRPRTTTR